MQDGAAAAAWWWWRGGVPGEEGRGGREAEGESGEELAHEGAIAAVGRAGGGRGRDYVGEEAAKGGIAHRAHALCAEALVALVRRRRPSGVEVVVTAARRRERDEGVALGEREEVEGRGGQQRQDVLHQPLRHERRRRSAGAVLLLLLLLLMLMLMVVWGGRRLAHDVPQHHGAARRGGELRCRATFGRLVEGRG
jgi:hypothetical protein